MNKESSLKGTKNSEDLAEINTTYEIFILVVAILSIIGLLVIFFVPIPAQLRQPLIRIDTGISVIFLFDFFRSLYREPDKVSYLKWGWLDLLGGIPSVTILHFARIARVVRGFRRMRRVRISEVESQFRGRRAESALLSTILFALLVIISASLIIYRIESQAPGGNILTGEEAIWWTLVTIATVGYGDYYPVTETGRFIAAIVTIVGVAMYGVIISYLATTFLSSQNTKSEIIELKAEVAEIKQLLLERETPSEEVESDESN